MLLPLVGSGQVRAWVASPLYDVTGRGVILLTSGRGHPPRLLARERHVAAEVPGGLRRGPRSVRVELDRHDFVASRRCTNFLDGYGSRIVAVLAGAARHLLILGRDAGFTIVIRVHDIDAVPVGAAGE